MLDVRRMFVSTEEVEMTDQDHTALSVAAL